MRPAKRNTMLRTAAVIGPDFTTMLCIGKPGMLWMAMPTSGRMSSNEGSASTAAAPVPVSSAGWNSRCTVPRSGRRSLSLTASPHTIAGVAIVAALVRHTLCRGDVGELGQLHDGQGVEFSAEQQGGPWVRHCGTSRRCQYRQLR